MKCPGLFSLKNTKKNQNCCSLISILRVNELCDSQGSFNTNRGSKGPDQNLISAFDLCILDHLIE